MLFISIRGLWIAAHLASKAQLNQMSEQKHLQPDLNIRCFSYVLWEIPCTKKKIRRKPGRICWELLIGLYCARCDVTSCLWKERSRRSERQGRGGVREGTAGSWSIDPRHVKMTYRQLRWEKLSAHCLSICLLFLFAASLGFCSLCRSLTPFLG